MISAFESSLVASVCEWPPLVPWTIVQPAAATHSAIQ